MKLHTVFITYNRLELTKIAIQSYLDTVTLPFTLWVVDNASTDGTQKWLGENLTQVGMGHTLLPENRYPGSAANHGWEAVEFSAMASEATHLHRADNDFSFLPGWCNEVEYHFRRKNLGQLGLRTDDEEVFNTNNVGGNCIIRRHLWDMGLRYDERPWPQISVEVGTGHSEDSLLSPAVKRMGYKWARVKKPCIVPLSDVDASDPYYVRSLGDRGIVL